MLRPLRRLAAASLLLCCFAEFASVRLPAAPDFWLTATPTQAPDDARGSQSFILRELARQAVVLAALHEAGQTPGDEIFDASLSTAEDKLPRLRLNAPWRNDSVTLTLALESAAQSAAPLELGLDAGGAPHERAERLARSLAPMLSGPLAAWLRANIHAATPVKGSAPLTAERIRQLEAAPDPVNCFELLRHWHGAASTAPSARSPETLAGLARAYILLGESTRHHWSALSSASAARALLYSALLQHLHPEHPLALETRVWVLGLGGYHAQALNALEALAARGQLPDWHPVLDAAVRYQTPRLAQLAHARATWSPLAAWLALISLENQRTPNLYERHLAEFAPLIPHNPRPVYVANHVLGVSGRPPFTEKGLLLAPRWLSEKVASLPSLPPSLREHADGAPAPARVRSFALASRTVRDEAYPAWGSLGRILWDTQFAFTVDRLHFMAAMWSVSTEREVEKLRPALSGHSRESVLATLSRADDRRVDRSAPFDQVRLGDVVEGMDAYVNWAEGLSARFADHSASHASNLLWYLSNDDIHSLRRLYLHANVGARGRAVRRHLATSPAHPAVLADAIRFDRDWENHLADARARHPDNPLISAAAGERLLAEGRAADAIPQLEFARRELGESSLYDDLADAYLETGDEANWLATRLAFNELPDAGLSHARNSIEIAKHYLVTHRPALAVPHAEKAGQSWAAWAMEAAAIAHAIAGDHAKARVWIERQAKRYDDDLADRVAWHAVAGYGDRNELLARLRADNSSRNSLPRDYELLGLPKEAVDRHLEAYKSNGDNYSLMLAGLGLLETGDAARAREIFARLPAEYSGNRVKDATRVANHRLASLFLAHIDDSVHDEEFLDRVSEIIRAQGLNREPMDRYAPDLLYFATRFLRLRGRASSSEVLLVVAAEHPTYPDTGRYVFSLLALEFKQRGRDLLEFYRQPAAD